MGLRDKLDDTKFRSLKFGGDTPGGGNSGQPYIKSPSLKDIDNKFNRFRLTRFDDGLVRGGAVGALNASITDTIRIGKFFVDFPKGPLFLAKQVGLQLSNPKLEVRKGATGLLTTAIGATRIYNLGINTLAQVPVNAFGGHITRHGLLPIQDEADKYIKIATDNNQGENAPNNRLVTLKNKFRLGDRTHQGDNKNIFSRKDIKNINRQAALAEGIKRYKPYNIGISDDVVYSYTGGPESVYGIGKTVIQRKDFTEDRIIISNATQNSYNNSVGRISDPNNFNILNAIGKGDNSLSNYNGVKIEDYTKQNAVPSLTFVPKSYTNLTNTIQTETVGKAINKNIPNTRTGEDGLVPSNSTNKIDVSTNYKDTKKILYDLSETQRTLLKKALNKNIPNTRTVEKTGLVPSGSLNNITVKTSADSKINLGKTLGKAIVERESGKRKTYTQYNRKDNNVFKEVGFSPINPFTGESLGDIDFTAYIKGIKMGYSSNWNEHTYIGRSEPFYTYNKYNRKGSFTLQLPAFNEDDLNINIDKLTNLLKISGGAYTQQGILGGIITYIRVGAVLNNYCIIDNIDFSISDDAGWDIDIELPYVVDVNVSFTMLGFVGYDNIVTLTPPTPPPAPPPPPPPTPAPPNPNPVQAPTQILRTDGAIYGEQIRSNNAVREIDSRFRRYYKIGG